MPSVPFNVKTLELYSLRLLLHHVPGAAVSFESLRTVAGNVCPTFQAACIELGLMENEAELDKVMEEAFLIDLSTNYKGIGMYD